MFVGSKTAKNKTGKSRFAATVVTMVAMCGAAVVAVPSAGAAPLSLGTPTSTPSVTQLPDSSVVTDPISGKSYYIPAGNSPIGFAEAEKQASLFSYKNTVGHLVTPISAQENSFVKNLLVDRSAWMALQDTGAIGGFKRNLTWTAGPLMGTTITRCTLLTGNDNCQSVGSEFSSWGGVEPNNYFGVESHGVMDSSNGRWNDVAPQNRSFVLAVEFDQYTTVATGAFSIASTSSPTVGALTSYQYSTDGGSTWVAPKAGVQASPSVSDYQLKLRAVNGAFTVDVAAPLNSRAKTFAYSVDGGTTWTPVNSGSCSTRIVSVGNGASFNVVRSGANSSRTLLSGLKPNTVYPVQIGVISAGAGKL